MKEHKVMTFRIKETSRVQPLAWCKGEISKKEMQRLTKKFRNDDDFDGAAAGYSENRKSWYFRLETR